MKTSDEIAKIVFMKMAEHEIKMKERRRKILKTAVPLMLILVVAAVSFSVWVSYNPEVFNSGEKGNSVFNDPKYPVRLWTETPFAEAYIELNYIASSNLEEMIDNSEVVVKGKFFLNYNSNSSDVFESVETFRNIGTFSNGIEYLNTKTSLKRFTVNEVYKGEVEKKIYIEDHLYDLVKYNDYEIDFVNPLYLNHDIGIEYILFLNKNEETGYYEFATEPNTILVLKDNVKLQSNVIKEYGSSTYSELLDKRNKTGKLIKINYNALDFVDDISGLTTSEITQILKGENK